MEHKIINIIMPKIMVRIAIIWTIGFLIVGGLRLVDQQLLDLAVNIFELVYGLFAGIMIVFYVRLFKNTSIIMGTAIAIFSWVLGQLYWISYTTIHGDILTYPSVGDMGFTGAYFLLIGVISMIIKEQPSIKKNILSYFAFLIMVIPLVLFFIGKNKLEALMYNFLLAFAVSLGIYKIIAIRGMRQYFWFKVGVVLLGITDVIFIISVSMYPKAYTLTSDALYPICISMISYGILKGGNLNFD